jgi:hypothetical protein
MSPQVQKMAVYSLSVKYWSWQRGNWQQGTRHRNDFRSKMARAHASLRLLPAKPRYDILVFSALLQ